MEPTDFDMVEKALHREYRLFYDYKDRDNALAALGRIKKACADHVEYCCGCCDSALPVAKTLGEDRPGGRYWSGAGGWES